MFCLVVYFVAHERPGLPVICIVVLDKLQTALSSVSIPCGKPQVHLVV